MRKALDAVELARPPSCAPVAAPPLCSPGWTASEVWADGFENTVSGRWTTSAGYGVDAWNVDIPGWHSGTGDSGLYFTGNASDGLHHLWGYDGNRASDSTVEMASGVTLPAGARLQFDHSFGFDNWGPRYFDGGVLEYCTGACSGWQDAGALIRAGARYNGTVYGTVNQSGNILSGRGAFAGDSHGYTSTQLSLASLAGQSVRFRFRIGTDRSGDDYGWYVDGFRIYRCLAPATATTVTGFTPTTGPAGTSVVITGSGFTGATRVLFGGTPATFTVDSATQIRAVVPVGATTGSIGVTTPAGTGTSGELFVVTEPCSFEIAPGSAIFVASPTSDGRETGNTQGGVVGVTTGVDCAWTAASGAGWILAGASRTGPGAVDYSVFPNKGPARTGSLTIAGRTFTVDQRGTLRPFTAENLTNAVVDARLTRGSAAWADYDDDGDLDILLTGYDWAGVPATKLFRSEGYLNTDVLTGMTGVGDSPAAWGDYDNDGDVDLLIAGRDASAQPVTRVYRNDQGAFVDIRASLAGVSHGAVTWGDYDNDGDLDILVTGSGDSGPVTRLYRNEGGVFTDVAAGLPASPAAQWPGATTTATATSTS